MSPLVERFASHRGGRVRYLIGGTGPPLVLCHGFLGSAENFSAWFGAVAAYRTLIVPDLPGFGRSAPLPGPHRSGELAGAVATVLDQVGVDDFDLAGLCLGSSVALCLARRRPGAVTRLVLHTPLLAPRMVRRRFHLQVSAMTAPGVFPAVAWLSRRRLVSDAYKRLMVEGKDVDGREAAQNFENQCRAEPRAAREWLREGLSRDDIALLRQRSGPTLVIVARADRVVEVERLVALAPSLPGVTLDVVEDAGHGWTAAYVQRQLAALHGFLAQP